MIVWDFIGLVLGLLVGSFVGALAIRWPSGESVLLGRSRCDSCRVVINPRHLVPVFSYILAKGKCSACGAAIPRVHLAAELAGGAIGLLAFALAPDWSGVAGALFGWALLALALLDARFFWLPDALTVPLLLGGIGGGIIGIPPSTADRLIGAGAGFAAIALIGASYRRLRGRVGLGAGDAKLVAAIGAWTGWQGLPAVIAGAGLLGLAVAAGLHARGRDISLSSRLPLGTFLAISAWLAWLWLRTATD